jgi:translation initiation factor 3 subunit I
MKPFLLSAHSNPITQLRFNKEGDLLFVSSKDRNVSVWYTENGELLGSFQHEGAVNSIDIDGNIISFYLENSKRLIAGVGTGDICIWDVSTGDLITKIDLLAPVKFVQYALGDQKILAVTDKAYGKNFSIHIIEIPSEIFQSKSYFGSIIYSNLEKIEPILSITLDSRIYNAVWGPLNETIICCCQDGTIHKFNAEVLNF